MLLKVENLIKIYESGFLRRKQIKAVDNISFTVKDGEIVSLVGESGSGKTTTMKMILRLIKPTSGTILFNERDIYTIPKKEYWRSVQAIFQDPFSSFNPTPFYKVDRILKLPFKLLDKMPKSEMEKRIKESLINVGLNPSDILGKYPHELSGGQMQRILIARCLIVGPKIVLADEPTSMIDASTRAIVLNLLRKLKDNGMSIIFVTHDVSQAFYISDRMLVMYRGQIVDEGPVEEVVYNPKHEYTKRLMKDVPKLYERFEDLK
jgi:peptide/nickel transport system ATP-binding protein